MADIADVLKPFENKYYQILNGDCTSYGGFQHSKNLGEWTEAPDWNPDPAIACQYGLHVVKKHPLFAWAFIDRENPVYAEVATDPFPPVKSSDGDKCRAKRVVKLRWVTKKDPEFAPEVLQQIALTKDYHKDIRKYAFQYLDDDGKMAVIKEEIVRKNFNNFYISSVREFWPRSVWRSVVPELTMRQVDWLLCQVCESDRKLIIRALDPVRQHATFLRLLSSVSG